MKGCEHIKIQESAENYLETVLVVSAKKGHVRQIDVCSATNFSRPTVSIALRDLAKAGYLNIDDEGYITLTEAGHSIADRIYERHCVISNFLIALGTCEETAYSDACKIEHDISDESFNNLKLFYDNHFINK